MAKKKGPPYEDDPECKYIVIEDPWPGNLHGKARDAPYWRWLGAWVYFMLGKNAAPENTYSVNTRAEVIVKLPEHVDITPILGAHRWRQFLHGGDPRDVQRVSYIFEYNYRLKGEPERHNWESHEPVGSFEPPPNLGCPVKFPYPSPHWASLDGRNCRDLARSLPASRVRTPTPPPHSPPQKSAPPPPSLYEPYQTPAHLTIIREEQSGYRYDDDKQGSGEAKSALQPPVAKFANKLDPYEEEDAALRLVKSEPTEPNLGLASAKEEPSDFNVKLESTDLSIKSEPTDRLVKINEPPAPAQPSEAMVAAFEQWQRAQVGQASSAPLSADPEVLRSAAEPEQTVASMRQLRAISERQEVPLPPLAPTLQHRSMNERYEANSSRDSRVSRPPPDQAARVKAEPQDVRIPTSDSADAEFWSNRNEGYRTGRSLPVVSRPAHEPKMPQHALQGATKRIKREEHDEPLKRPRTGGGSRNGV